MLVNHTVSAIPTTNKDFAVNVYFNSAMFHAMVVMKDWQARRLFDSGADCVSMIRIWDSAVILAVKDATLKDLEPSLDILISIQTYISRCQRKTKTSYRLRAASRPLRTATQNLFFTFCSAVVLSNILMGN